MAELNLTLKYKYMPARAVFITMMACLPIWEVAAPIGVGYIISLIMRQPETVPFWLTVTGIPGLLLFIAASIAVTGCAEDNRLHLSKDGLSFPPFLLAPLKFRRARQWSELLSAAISTPESGKGRLFLTFSGGASLSMDLNCFNREDQEQLLLAVELWGTNCQRSQELIEYQNKIQNEAQGISQGVGYTQMWEEELGRRFQATSFVPLEPKQKLLNGKIEIVRQLAFGGLSAIYLAQENQRDMVVIKEAVVPANAEPQARAEAERHLIREAEMLAKFQHEHVARVLDHFIENGRHYLKLEYINGTDLRQYVKQNGAISQEQALNWGLQILEVLACLHNQNPPILHRDLTPENLVLAKDAIMLIDFGAANEFVGTATGTIVGKHSYMPAEQLRGKSVIESDIYAFGGTMHYLMTAKDPLPLSQAKPKSVCSEIDQELDDVIAKCCAFEPEDRFHSAAEVMEAFRSIQARLSGESVPVLAEKVV